jgi:hypothetical protein
VTGVTSVVQPGKGGTSAALCSHGPNDFVLSGGCEIGVGLQLTSFGARNDNLPNAAFICDVWNTGGASVITATAVCVPGQ